MGITIQHQLSCTVYRSAFSRSLLRWILCFIRIIKLKPTKQKWGAKKALRETNEKKQRFILRNFPYASDFMAARVTVTQFLCLLFHNHHFSFRFTCISRRKKTTTSIYELLLLVWLLFFTSSMIWSCMNFRK